MEGAKVDNEIELEGANNNTMVIEKIDVTVGPDQIKMDKTFDLGKIDVDLDFEKMVHTEADLKKMELAMPDFEKMVHIDPDFEKMVHIDPDFEKMELAEPNFKQTELAEPYFKNMKLAEPVFEKMVLAESDLEKKENTEPDVEKIELTNPYVEKELAKPYFEKIEQNEPDFVKMDLADPDFEKMKLAEPNFKQTELAEPYVKKMKVAKPDFEKKEETKPDFEKKETKPDLEKIEVDEPELEKKKLAEDFKRSEDTEGHDLAKFWVNYLECRLLEKRPQFLQQAKEAGEAVYQEKRARLAAEARSREQDVQASTAAASSAIGGEAVGDEDEMEQLVEQAEVIVEDITHQTGKKKKNITAAGVPKCEAELRREKNMAEHRKMALDLGLIKEKKPKQPAAKRKAPAPEILLPTRRSGREKKPVKYFNEDVDWEEEHYGKRRKIKENKAEEKVVQQPLRRTPRAVTIMDYAMADPDMDGGIFCHGCQMYMPPPCIIHGDEGMKFMSISSLNLQVAKSGEKKAGEGLFNKGEVIPEGTMIGPYTGEFITKEKYEAIERQGKESGNAWLVRDSETMVKTVGYIDPGSSYDTTFHLLTKANHAPKENQIGFVATQYLGKIYYRANRDVLKDVEIFVNYGPEYAAELGIDDETYATYSRRENHKTAAVVCSACNGSFSSQEFLNRHPCIVKTGPGCFQCQLCPKTSGTSQGLASHIRMKHTVATELSLARPVKGERVPCEESSCNETFTEAGNMRKHYRVAHLQEIAYKCTTCGVEFSKTSNLKKHFNTVHLKLRPYWCEVKGCEKTFGHKSNLTTHTKNVHMKVRAHPCSSPGCSYSSATANHLRQHVTAVHLKARPFLCYLSCKFAASEKRDLNRHKMRKHKLDWAAEEAERKAAEELALPFLCKVARCINRYSSEVERERHQEKMHPQEKIY